MEGGLLLDVVVGKGSTILELLAGEDQSLLVGWDAFLVLDLGLDIVDGIGGLDLEGDGLAVVANAKSCPISMVELPLESPRRAALAAFENES